MRQASLQSFLSQSQSSKNDTQFPSLQVSQVETDETTLLKDLETIKIDQGKAITSSSRKEGKQSVHIPTKFQERWIDQSDKEEFRFWIEKVKEDLYKLKCIACHKILQCEGLKKHESGPNHIERVTSLTEALSHNSLTLWEGTFNNRIRITAFLIENNLP